MRRVDFRWDWFGLAIVVAVLLHAVTVPRLFASLTEHREAPVEVSYVEVDDSPSPAELARLDEKKSAPDEPKRPDEQRPAEPRKREADPARREEAKPEPPKPPKPEVAEKPPEPPKPLPQQPPPPPPKLEPPKPHEIMVDQDQFPDEKNNADAKYLAQKNHRAKQDTATRNTNLARTQAGQKESPSAPSENQQPQPGMPNRKVAELQKRAGQEHQIVRSQPRAGDEGKSAQTRPGKLSMRGLTPHAVEPGPTQKPREGLELHDSEPGTLPGARAGTDGERAGSKAKGAQRPKLTLDPLDYDKIVGESVAANERRQAARAEVSRAPGRWDKTQKKLAMMRSSLENFTPDAHIGNEAELGTRAHPFAAYIATMHRSIHKLWAYDFLASLDGKGAFDPYNDMERWTLVGIVLSSEGVVEQVTINHPSGYAPFDAAALDSVMSSSPFPPPPETIKSPDGKVYLDWTFHRDDRQCTTSGVFPHILERAGQKHAAGPKSQPM